MTEKKNSKKLRKLLLMLLFLIPWYTCAITTMNTDPNKIDFAVDLFMLLLPLCIVIFGKEDILNDTAQGELYESLGIGFRWAVGIALVLWLIIRCFV